MAIWEIINNLEHLPKASGTMLADTVVALPSSFLARADSVLVVTPPPGIIGSASDAADFCVSSVELVIGVEPGKLIFGDIFGLYSFCVLFDKTCNKRKGNGIDHSSDSIYSEQHMYHFSSHKQS